LDSKLHKTFKVVKKEKLKQEQNNTVVTVFHQNVQSINNKLLELNVIVQTELEKVDVLCLSEHWLREEYIKLISINEFKLTSNFSRSESIHGGTCIYVKHYLQTKEVNYIQGISKEKDFEMSAVEIRDYDMIVVCVYRSPDGDFTIFLSSLESVIKKVQMRKKRLLLCGDWNINFMQERKNYEQCRSYCHYTT
jgi:exonuclease III